MLQTNRLLLRQWKPEDAEGFAELNADPEVMKHFPATLTRQESDDVIARFQQRIAEQDWGLWAVERRDRGEFIRFVGLNRPRFDAHFTPCVEIGWRLKRTAWGHGFATEAATICLQYGFEQLRLADIVSFTSRHNVRSQQVMQRIGMTRDMSGDFLHPNLPADHRVAPHVLYRLSAEAWQRTSGQS